MDKVFKILQWCGKLTYKEILKESKNIMKIAYDKEDYIKNKKEYKIKKYVKTEFWYFNENRNIKEFLA